MIPSAPDTVPYRFTRISPRWKALTEHRDDDQWLRWRLKQVNRAIHKHRVLTQRELEARLSDFVRPGHPFVFPHHITELKQPPHDLIQVATEPVPFYTRRNMPRMYFEEVLAKKQDVVRGNLEICAQDTCGNIAESVVWKSLAQARTISMKPHVLGRVNEIDGHRTNGTLDTYGYVTTGTGTGVSRTVIPLGVEVKNVRHFLYPDSVEVWQTLRCAVELSCVPVLVARRFYPRVFGFAAAIGMLIHETQKQYFAAGLADDPRLANSVDELGFLDMIPWEDADPFLVRYFETTVPQRVAQAARRFERHRDLIFTYALHGELYDEGMTRDERKRKFEGFRQEFINLTGRSVPW